MSVTHRKALQRAKRPCAHIAQPSGMAARTVAIQAVLAKNATRRTCLKVAGMSPVCPVKRGFTAALNASTKKHARLESLIACSSEATENELRTYYFEYFLTSIRL